MTNWESPLRHMAPIPEHPARHLPGLIPDSKLHGVEVGDDQAKTCLASFGKRGPRHSRAADILQSFYQFLEGEGRAILAAEIRAFANDDTAMFQLANHLVQAILLPFKLAGGKAPAAPAVPMAMWTPDVRRAYAAAAAETRDLERLRQDVLRRDGHRCVYAGLYDYYSFLEGRIAVPKGEKVKGEQVDDAECAYIIPFALGDWHAERETPVETENKAAVWWTLHRYFPALQGSVDPAGVVRPENAVSLHTEASRRFGRCELSLWPVSNSQGPECGNVYETKVEPGWSVASRSGSAIIELEQGDASVAMPDPESFKVHHIVSLVLKETGLGAHMDRVLAAVADKGLAIVDILAEHARV